MKKCLTMAVLVGAFLVSFILGGSQAVAAEINIKLATYYSPNMLQGDKALAENIEKMSGGRIKVQIFAGGELVSSGDILKATKSGVVDMGHGSGFHFSEVKIAAIEAGLPMAWTSAMDAQTLWDQFGFHELVAKAYEAQGVVYLGPYWAAPYAILSKKPINSLADLQQMKIRATSGAGKMFAKVNVPTVYMKPEEIYTALSTGQIDGTLYGGAVEYKEMKWYEVAPYYCTTFMLSPINDVLIINPKLWQKLPDDLKAIIQTAAYKARWDYFTWVMGQEYKIRGEIFSGKTTSLPDADVAKLTEAAQSVWDEMAAMSPDSAEAVEKIKELQRYLGRLK